MGFMTGLKANKAVKAQRDGNTEEALRLYAEAVSEGLNVPRYILSYAVLLLRTGQYEACKDLLVKHQKDPGMTGESKTQLIVDYAVCCHKLGDTKKAVSKLDELHRHGPTGTIYQTLGYLYADLYDMKNAPAEEAAAEEAVPAAPDAESGAEEAKSPAGLFREGMEKALAFNQEAVEYDDEDSICLDNLGQVWYRVFGDKEKAKEYFDKAIAFRPGQIDTLWFLSRYDLEAGNTAAAVEKLELAAEGRFSPLNYVTKEIVDAEIARLKA
ncbi:MAG: hypothetical protein Q4G19_02575 [Clostridia bacterium]|nr:hypothetical protein [Clostridia bacterium]